MRRCRRWQRSLGASAGLAACACVVGPGVPEVGTTGDTTMGEEQAATSSADGSGETTPDPSEGLMCGSGDPEVALVVTGPASSTRDRDGDLCVIDSLTEGPGGTRIRLGCLEDGPDAEPLELHISAAPAPSLAALVPGETVAVWHEGHEPPQYYDCWYSYGTRIERDDGTLLLALRYGCEVELDPFAPQKVESGPLLCKTETSCGDYLDHAVTIDLGDGLVGELATPSHAALGPYEVWATHWEKFDKTYPCDQYPGWHHALLIVRTIP